MKHFISFLIITMHCVDGKMGWCATMQIWIASPWHYLVAYNNVSSCANIAHGNKVTHIL